MAGRRCLAALVTLALAACTALPAGLQAGQTAALEWVDLKVNSVTVRAELANTPLARQTGLMHRARLGRNEGMLFVFDRQERQCMWMKNTLIDLDVAFADPEGQIVNVATMKAGSTSIHCSAEPALFALEMEAGWFDKHGAGPGSRLTLPQRIQKIRNQPRIE